MTNAVHRADPLPVERADVEHQRAVRQGGSGSPLGRHSGTSSGAGDEPRDQSVHFGRGLHVRHVPSSGESVHRHGGRQAVGVPRRDDPVLGAPDDLRGDRPDDIPEEYALSAALELGPSSMTSV